jgi:murein tripeptide amidase MpaA
MVNPDGVIHGNTRTNLLGYDVNRKWEVTPTRKESDEVYSIVMGLMKKIPPIVYLIDLHGHSKK